MMIPIPMLANRKPVRMIAAGRRSAGLLPDYHCRCEHRQRERGQRQAGLHGVVLQGHLEVERQRDHRAAQRDLLEHLTGDAGGEVRVPEQVRVEQGHLLRPLAPDEPPGQGRQGHGSDRHEQADELAALLPDEDPEHHPTHAEHGQQGADQVDLAREPVYGTSRISLIWLSTTAMITTSSAKPTRQDR